MRVMRARKVVMWLGVLFVVLVGATALTAVMFPTSPASVPAPQGVAVTAPGAAPAPGYVVPSLRKSRDPVAAQSSQPTTSQPTKGPSFPLFDLIGGAWSVLVDLLGWVVTAGVFILIATAIFGFFDLRPAFQAARRSGNPKKLGIVETAHSYWDIVWYALRPGRDRNEALFEWYGINPGTVPTPTPTQTPTQAPRPASPQRQGQMYEIICADCQNPAQVRARTMRHCQSCYNRRMTAPAPTSTP